MAGFAVADDKEEEVAGELPEAGEEGETSAQWEVAGDGGEDDRMLVNGETGERTAG